MGPLNQFVGGKDGLGPRGGTLCFGDSDLRPIYDRQSRGFEEVWFQKFRRKTESSMFPVHFLVCCTYIYINCTFIFLTWFAVIGYPCLMSKHFPWQGSGCSPSQLERAGACNSAQKCPFLSGERTDGWSLVEDWGQCGFERFAIFTGGDLL